jgi:hypothetical protein
LPEIHGRSAEGFVLEEVAERQKAAFATAGVPLPEAGG